MNGVAIGVCEVMLERGRGEKSCASKVRHAVADLQDVTAAFASAAAGGAWPGCFRR